MSKVMPPATMSKVMPPATGSLILMAVAGILNGCQSHGASMKPAASTELASFASTPKFDLIPYGEGVYVPSKWLGQPIQFSATSPNTADMELSRQFILIAAAKYPVTMLEEHLSRVVICGEVSVRGVTIGGTNSKDGVYLHAMKDQSEATMFEGAFHHEFSSILLRKHKHLFDEKAWRACAAPGSEYIFGNGVDAIKQGQASQEQDDAMNAAGFLNQYACSDFENDFNEIARMVLMGGPELQLLLSKYDRLRCKASLLVRFYKRIDPTFKDPTLGAYFMAIPIDKTTSRK